MVTWGQNTVHTIGSTLNPAQPTPFGGSSPPPLSSHLFGSSHATTTSLFGNPASSPSTPGLFGSSPAPPPSTTAGFSWGGFGGPLQQQPYQYQQQYQYQQYQYQQPQQQPPSAPQIPAQAALQAHLAAQARQEEARIMGKLEQLYQAYTGTALAPSNHQSAPFSTTYYTQASPELIQQQWLQGSLIGQPQPVVPPRPLQISSHEWNVAAIQNPNYVEYMPAALVGAEALQGRLSYQQEMVHSLAQHIHTIHDATHAAHDRHTTLVQQLQSIQKTRQHQHERLTSLMKKVQIIRAWNLPLQKDEVIMMDKLKSLATQVEQVRSQLSLVNTTPTRHILQSSSSSTELLPIVKEHRDLLANLTLQTKRDVRDLELLQDHFKTRSGGMPK